MVFIYIHYTPSLKNENYENYVHFQSAVAVYSSIKAMQSNFSLLHIFTLTYHYYFYKNDNSNFVTFSILDVTLNESYENYVNYVRNFEHVIFDLHL